MIKGITTYFQVHKIINEDINDKKGFFMKKE
jgi:hypothetical protein